MRVFASLLASITLASFIASPFAQAAHVKLAPADEYFGRQKMSILEVGNRLRDMSRRLHSPAVNAQDIVHTASMTEDAMRDWQRKYPADPWLRKDRAALARIYGFVRRLRH
ncbi:MAG TPA: hypothetical protein VKT72_06525 [Candidatus Baltobacteraceae bacterium]|nr:hypothetical protein [Candidatus Baltobacteraceae bacterium]